jgi:hypothetical protein
VTTQTMNARQSISTVGSQPIAAVIAYVLAPKVSRVKQTSFQATFTS